MVSTRSMVANNSGTGGPILGTSKIATPQGGLMARFTNTIFSGNTAAGSDGVGGAVYIVDANANVIINNCTFVNNAAFGGAGAIFQDSLNGDGTLQVCASNEIPAESGRLQPGPVVTAGGAMVFTGGSSLYINGSEFTENTSPCGGMAIYSCSVSGTIQHTLFQRNAAPAGGPPLTPANSTIAYGPSQWGPALVDCSFDGNTFRFGSAADWTTVTGPARSR